MDLAHLYGKIDTVASSTFNFRSTDNFERDTHKSHVEIHRSPLVISRYAEGQGAVHTEGSSGYTSTFNQLLETAQSIVKEIKTEPDTRMSHMKTTSYSTFSQSYKSPLKMSLIGEYKTEGLLDSYGRKMTFKFPSRDPKLLIEESRRLISEIKSPLKASRTKFNNIDEHLIEGQGQNTNRQSEYIVDHQNYGSSGSVIKHYQSGSDTAMITDSRIMHDKKGSMMDSQGQSFNFGRQSKIGTAEKTMHLSNTFVPELSIGKEPNEFSSNLSVSHRGGSKSPNERFGNTGNKASRQITSVSKPAQKSVVKKSATLEKQKIGKSYGKKTTISDLEDDSPQPNMALDVEPQPKITLTYVPTKPKQKGILKESRDSFQSFQKSIDGFKSTKSIDSSFGQSAIGRGMSAVTSELNLDSRNTSKKRTQFSGKSPAMSNYNWTYNK